MQPVDPAAPARRWDALNPTVLVVAVSYLAVGVVFGAMDVVVVGFTDAEGVPAFAGLALAVYAGGSLVAGLAYGVARIPGTLTSRFLGTAVLFGLAAQLLWGVGSLTVLIVAGFIAGLTIAPVLVSGLSLVESRVPRWALTEALSWTTTGLTLGVTAGSAAAGWAVDHWGAESAFAVPAWPPRWPPSWRSAGHRCCAARPSRFRSMERRAWSDLLRGNPSVGRPRPRRAAPPPIGRTAPVASVPTITLNNGVEIPQLGFGVFQIKPEDTVKATTSALEIGYRHIDTAQMYGNEREVGMAVRESGIPRDEVFVTSKLNNNRLERDDILRSFDQSLADLGFDQLDLFLVHWPLPAVADYVARWKVMEEIYAERPGAGDRCLELPAAPPEQPVRAPTSGRR